MKKFLYLFITLSMFSLPAFSDPFVGTLKSPIVKQGNPAFTSYEFVNSRYKNKKTKSSKNSSSMPSSKRKRQKFIGYVKCGLLHVRTSPRGRIDNTIRRGTAVKVLAKVGNWYKISYNNRIRYVYGKYIITKGSSTRSKSSKDKTQSKYRAKASSKNNKRSNTRTRTKLTVSEKNKIVKAAKSLVGSRKFRGKDVRYGKKACAAVVTTALKIAGVLKRVYTGVLKTISVLHRKGWKEVRVPPFQAGDVITWRTYDRNGDGKKDNDTHIGIIVKKGNTFKAMSNSSRLKMPRYTSPYYVPITRVLRKVS